ncbi:MAG: hypothetical protein H3C49_07715 [Alphaproteobacteria bacterium]|nr:hypothetical protein [Alphaproteobacteria bacterium]
MPFWRSFCMVLFVFSAPVTSALAQDKASSTFLGYDCLLRSDAGCLYKILAERILNEPRESNTFPKIVESLIKRDELDLAEAFVYRWLAEIDETNTYPSGPFHEGILLLAKIKKQRGEDAEAARFFKVALSKDTRGFSLDDLGENPDERIKLLQNAVATYEEKLFTPVFYGRDIHSIARDGIQLAVSLENLATEYGRQGRFSDARSTLEKINTDYVLRGWRKKYPSVFLSGVDGRLVPIEKIKEPLQPGLFNIDSFEKFQHLLQDSERGGRGMALLAIVYEWALHEVEKGDKAFADKALIFAESMLEGRYRTNAPYPEVKRFVNANPMEIQATLAQFYALAGREERLMPYLESLGTYTSAQRLPNILRGLLARGNVELAMRIAALPRGNKVEAYTLILTAVYKNGDRAALRRVIEKSLSETKSLPKDHIAQMMKENARIAYLSGDRAYGKKLAMAALAVDPLTRASAVDLTCASGGAGFCRVYSPAPDAVRLLMRNGDAELAASYIGEFLQRAVFLAEAGFYDEALRIYEDGKKEAKNIESAGWWIAYHIARSDKHADYRAAFERLVQPFEQMPFTRNAMWLPERAEKAAGLELMRSRMESRNPDVNMIALPLQLANVSINDLQTLDKYFDDMGFSDLKHEIWNIFLAKQTDYPSSDYGIPYFALIKNLLDEGRIEEARRLMTAYINPVYFVSEFGAVAQFSTRRDAALLSLYVSMAEKGMFDEVAEIESLAQNPSVLTDMRFQLAKIHLKQGNKVAAASALEGLPAKKEDLSGLRERLDTEDRPHDQSYKPVLDVAERLMDRVFVLEALGRDTKPYEDMVKNIHGWVGHPSWKYKVSIELAKQAYAAGRIERSHAFAGQALVDIRDGFGYVSISPYREIVDLQRAVGDEGGLSETLRYIFDAYTRSKEKRMSDFFMLVDVFLIDAAPVSSSAREDIIFMLGVGENIARHVPGRVAGGRPDCAVPNLDKERFQVHMVTTAEGLDSINLNLFFWQKVFLSSLVRVEAGDVPLVLVLNAARTHSWTLDVAKGARIAAVIVGGMNADVSGVPDGVPIINVSNWGNKKLPSCNRVVAFSGDIANGSAQKLFAALDIVRELVGRPVDHLYWRGEPQGYFLVRALTQAQLDKKADYSRLANFSGLSSAKRKGQRDYIGRGKQVAEAIVSGVPMLKHDDKRMQTLKGRAAFEKLIEEGYLRPAEKADAVLLDAWAKGAAARFKALNEDFELGDYFKKIDYVVLKPIVFPEPDRASFSSGATFFVSEGIGADLQNDGYNEYSVYYMDGFGCKNVPQMKCDY